jgi:phosphatidylglycerophosphate synthase
VLTKAIETASVRFALNALLALGLTLWVGRTEILALAGLLGIVSVGVWLAQLETPRSWLPTCITAVRLLVTCGLCPYGPSLSGLVVVSVVLFVFTLDWVDGQVARRTDSVSQLGGHLDNESDAFLTLTVCVLLYLRGPSGAWVLTPGLLRYVYVLFVRVFPSRGQVPRSTLGARAFGIALVGLMVGFLGVPYLSRVAPALATLLLSYSFGHSFYWSLKKPEPAA